MPDGMNLPLLNFEMMDREETWGKAVYDAFVAAKVECAGRGERFNARETLKEILGRDELRLDTPIDLTGNGSLRGGANSDGRFVACVILTSTEFHKHQQSKSFQMPLYVEGGDALALSINTRGEPLLESIRFGEFYENNPGQPHAFVLKDDKHRFVGSDPDADQVTIFFLAWTPRDLTEDTQGPDTAEIDAYRTVVGVAPVAPHARPAAPML